MAISICDFDLWPDDEQEKQGLPLVPMLSRWNMTERSSKNHGLLHVQYAFLELPKVPAERPTTPGADLWAWLFVHAPELREVPADLAPGPYGDALELANQAKFTPGELEVYERTRDEIRQVIEIAAARWAEGKAAGLREGETRGEVKAKAAAVLAVLAARGVAVSDEVRARVETCKDASTLDRWLGRAATAASDGEVVAG